MARGHTYDKWKELGYQVKKGEKHSFNYYGNKCFTRDQVVKIDDIDEDDVYDPDYEGEQVVENLCGPDGEDFYDDYDEYHEDHNIPYHHWNPEDG